MDIENSRRELKEPNYLTINKRFRNTVDTLKTYQSTDYGRSHLPVIRKLRLKLCEIKKFREMPKLQYNESQDGSVCKQMYNDILKKNSKGLEFQS